MRNLAPTLGVLFTAAGVAAVALGGAFRSDGGAARDAARSALVAPESANSPAPRDRSARYWWSLAGFERAVGAAGASRSDRLDRLGAVAADLAHQAGRGSPAARSLSLDLLGLTRVAQAYLGGAQPGAHAAASALRAAVVLDPGSDDAKANLELVLQTRRSSKGTRPRDQGRGKRPGQTPPSQGRSTPASGAGGNVEGPPVGY
jgi:hypothetical protein